MVDPQEVLTAYLENERSRAAIRGAAKAMEERKHRGEPSDVLMGCLRRADKRDYEVWLAGYLRRGGRPTHVYLYDFPSSHEFYVAVRDVAMEPLYGAHALGVIAPEGVNWAIGEGLGHSIIYEMWNCVVHGGRVPAYQDLELV